MKLGDVKIEHKIFCTRCEWCTVKLSDKTLWTTYSRCPNCGGFTDGIKLASSLDSANID